MRLGASVTETLAEDVAEIVTEHVTVKLRVNGEDREFADVATVADLLASLGLAGRRVAVEHNREVVPASSWSAAALSDGDVLEIVHFVGGG